MSLFHHISFIFTNNFTAQVRELENEKKLWTSSILNSSNGTKKATAAFAFLLIVSLNVSNLSTIKSSSPLVLVLNQSSIHVYNCCCSQARDGLSPVKSGARTLLSTFERDPYAEDYSEGVNIIIMIIIIIIMVKIIQRGLISSLYEE